MGLEQREGVRQLNRVQRGHLSGRGGARGQGCWALLVLLARKTEGWYFMRIGHSGSKGLSKLRRDRWMDG